MFTATAVATLALGIGGTVATFGIVRGVLLRPLPVRDQGHLVVLSAKSRSLGSSHVGLPNGVLWDFAARSRTVSEVTAIPAFAPATPFVARDGSRTIHLALTTTTGNFFDVLGVRAGRGRLLNAGDDTQSHDPAIVLSNTAWMREFGGDTGIVGRTIQLPQGSYTVVGIAAPEFDYPHGSDAWISLPQMVRRLGFDDSPEGGYWDLVARLRENISVAQVTREFNAFLVGYSSPRLGDARSRGAVVESYADSVIGDQRSGLLVLAAAVGLVLVIAVANVAGLLVSRTLARRADLAVRSALGASPARLRAQLSVEHFILGLVGGLFGLFAAWAGLRFAVAEAPPGLARFGEIHIDVMTVAFGLTITVLSVVGFGAASVMVSGRQNMASALNGSALRGVAAVESDPSSRRFRQAIAVGELALAIVVLVAAGLLVRTLANLQRIDLGFEPTHLLFVVIERQDASSASTGDLTAAEARHRAVLNGLVEQLRTRPGIVGATPTSLIPFALVGGTGGIDQHFRLEGEPTAEALAGPTIRSDGALPNYFRVLGIPLVQGRTFDADDRAGSAGVAVVSEQMARLAWPGQNPLGKRLQLIDEFGRGPTRTIVGVVGDTRYSDLTVPRPAVYVPLEQSTPGAVVAIRTRGNPSAAIPTVERVLHGLDDAYGISKTVTMPQLLALELARPRFLMGVLSALSLIALLLGAVGLYGVMSLLVRQRTNELGIRLALGATGSAIRGLVLLDAARLVAVGVALGLIASVALSSMFRTLVFGVPDIDPLTLVSATLLLVVTMAAAVMVPAVRASRLDPMMTLRAP
jgi:predicted permease